MEKNIDVQTSILLAALIIASSIVYSAHSLKNTNVILPSQDAGAQNAVNLTISDRSAAPRQGNGKVQLIEFSDFQCPYCQTFFNNTYPQLKKDYIDTGKITFIYRYFPLSFHINAEKAAEAAECANEQGKFWQYHDALFQNAEPDGTNLDAASLKKYASQLALDTATFDHCLDGGAAASIIKADIAEGQRDGISGTPSFVVDGKLIVGAQPYSVFKQSLDAALK